jgi:hypothetical protein
VSLQTRLEALVAAVGADIKGIRAVQVTVDTAQTITGAKSFSAGSLLAADLKATPGNTLSLRSSTGLVRLFASASGITLFGTTTNDGGGVGVVGIMDATTIPSTNPTSGVVLYSDGGVLKVRQPDGQVIPIAPAGAASAPANMETTDTNQVITGVKTYPPGKLLMRSADGVTTAEPYSDVNAPQTLQMTENGVGGVTTPPPGQSVLYTPDGRGLKIKDDTGFDTTLAILDSGGLVNGNGVNLSQEYVGTQPSTPAVGGSMFTRFRARRLPAFVGPTGLDTALQPAFFSNRITAMMANPIQAAPTMLAATPTNVAAPTAVTPTAPNAAGALGGSVHRHRYPTSAATAGAGMGFRLTGQTLWMSNTANAGGFFFVLRWVTGTNLNRIAFGLQAATAAIAPGSDVRGVVANFIGFAKNQADTTIYAYSVAGTPATNTAVNTGISASVAGGLYEARLFCPSGSANTVYWSLQEITSGAFAQGQLTTTLPAANVALYPHVEGSNGTTAAAGYFDLQQLYIETDN